MAKNFWLLAICVLCFLAHCTDGMGLKSLNPFSKSKKEKSEKSKETAEQLLSRLRQKEKVHIRYPGVIEEKKSDGKMNTYFYPPPNAESDQPTRIDLSAENDGLITIECHTQKTSECKNLNDWKAKRLDVDTWEFSRISGFCEEPMLCGLFGLSKKTPHFTDVQYLSTRTIHHKLYVGCWQEPLRHIVLYRSRQVPAHIIYPSKREYELHKYKKQQALEQALHLQKKQKQLTPIKNVHLSTNLNDKKYSNAPLTKKEEEEFDKISQMLDESTNGAQKEYEDIYLRGFTKGFKAGLTRD